jgi:hypothetical protein
MGKNLLGRLGKSESDGCVHELFDDFLFAGLVLEVTEGIKERYQKARQRIKNVCNYFIYK